MKNDIQCKQCFTMLRKVYGEAFPKPKRVTHYCPACAKELYSERTTDNIKIRLNEK